MSIPSLPPLPYPTDPAPADGYDAFNDSVAQAQVNLNVFPPWSQGVVDKSYVGTAYGISTVTPLANWSCQAFSAFKIDHLITIDATFTYNGPGFTFGTNCLLTPKQSFCTLPVDLRVLQVGSAPVESAWSMNARIANTAVVVVIGDPTADVCSIVSGATPSRAVATGSQLLLHAFYSDQYFSYAIAP